MPAKELQMLIACAEGVRELTESVKELLAHLETFLEKAEAVIDDQEPDGSA